MFKNVWFVLSVNNFISTITPSRDCVWRTVHTHLSSVIIKDPSYFHRTHYSFLCQADLFCKSYLGFMWCSQTLTLHCSFGTVSLYCLKNDYQKCLFYFLTFLSVIPFSCPHFCKASLTRVKRNNTGSSFGLQMVLQIWMLLSQDTWTISEALGGKGWCHTPAAGLAQLRLCSQPCERCSLISLEMCQSPV